jgi:Family of unknown function (DUF5317)
MLLVAGAFLGLLAGLATGGSLRNLAERRLRWPLVVVAALVVKELGVRTELGTSSLAPWAFVLSLVALIVWALWHRDRLPGIWIVAAGMCLNLIVVVANAGHMPVPPDLARRGPSILIERGTWGQYTLAGPNTRLPWLEDWIDLPGPLGRLFPQAYSPGDLVAFVGMAVVLFFATRPIGGRAQQRAITTR